MVIKAQSPAGFAEEYIIESIWNNRFPPGTILPAERELSELIGVTRTTLREVLQRLARDGWLTIQHGKPTKVNNFWETSGLNILETLARLDHESVPQLIDNLLSVRTNISTIFVRTAFRQHPDKAQEQIRNYLSHKCWRKLLRKSHIMFVKRHPLPVLCHQLSGSLHYWPFHPPPPSGQNLFALRR